MPAFLQTIINIIVFLLCLSFVVCIHEAGHLAVAKLCNVYCFEYSIGFGPLLFKHKFKHKKKAKDGEVFNADEKEEGETQFSIRAFPLGGYVAMAGEDAPTTPDGIVVPPERCLNSVNHFKQVCIMLAGITMNFLLAILLFFCSNIVPQTRNVVSSNAVTISADSAASKMGLQTGDKITKLYQVYEKIYDKNGNPIDSLVFPAENQQETLTSYQAVNSSSITLSQITSYNQLSTACISYAAMDVFTAYSNDLFEFKEWHTEYDGWEDYYEGPDSTRTFHVEYERVVNGVTTTLTGTSEAIKTVESDTGNTDDNGNKISSYAFDYFGISPITESFNYSFGEAYVRAHQEFGSLFTGLYTALGSIFTPSGWKNVGGIISVYKMSAEGTTSGSAAYFLLLWGYISLNLGCFNLLPFPGLDGWQTLMAIIEACIRRKLPPKFKNVANTVGMLLLLALAAILIVKDIVVML